jgi:hemoglobin-like flavoprotein
MNDEEKKLVKDSWKKVVPIADQAVQMFYDRLFQTDPTTKPLFKAGDLGEQRKKLIQALALVVKGLDNLDSIVPVVADLGRRHVAYGVTKRHYDSVGNALLWTLEQGLGPDWTPKTEAAWTTAYTLLSGVMRQAYDEPAPA